MSRYVIEGISLSSSFSQLYFIQASFIQVYASRLVGFVGLQLLENLNGCFGDLSIGLLDGEGMHLQIKLGLMYSGALLNLPNNSRGKAPGSAL